MALESDSQLADGDEPAQTSCSHVPTALGGFQ